MNTSASTRDSLKYQLGSSNRKGPQHATGDLRNKIVELLSSAANGCLSELGYYPGMQEEFQQLIQANAVLQNDNAKLYEDNRALARVVAIQNDRLAFAAGEDNAKLKQLAEMNEKIEFLSSEQTKLKRANEMLKVTSVDQGHEKLFAEWQMLQARNNDLERDYTRLQNNYSTLYNSTVANGTVPPGKQADQRMQKTSGE
jgi:chromosome segregation ATPase